MGLALVPETLSSRGGDVSSAVQVQHDAHGRFGGDVDAQGHLTALPGNAGVDDGGYRLAGAGEAGASASAPGLSNGPLVVGHDGVRLPSEQERRRCRVQQHPPTVAVGPRVVKAGPGQPRWSHRRGGLREGAHVPNVRPGAAS